MNSLHMQSVGGWHDIAHDTAYFPLVTHERKSTNHIAEDGCISLVNTRYEITIIPTTIRCQLYCVCYLGVEYSQPTIQIPPCVKLCPLAMKGNQHERLGAVVP